MDTLTAYRKIVQDTLQKYVDVKYAYGDIHNEALFDATADRYMVVSVGLEGIKRVHGCLIPLTLFRIKCGFSTMARKTA